MIRGCQVHNGQLKTRRYNTWDAIHVQVLKMMSRPIFRSHSRTDIAPPILCHAFVKMTLSEEAWNKTKNKTSTVRVFNSCRSSSTNTGYLYGYVLRLHNPHDVHGNGAFFENKTHVEYMNILTPPYRKRERWTIQIAIFHNHVNLLLVDR